MRILEEQAAVLPSFQRRKIVLILTGVGLFVSLVLNIYPVQLASAIRGTGCDLTVAVSPTSFAVSHGGHETLKITETDVKCPGTPCKATSLYVDFYNTSTSYESTTNKSVAFSLNQGQSHTLDFTLKVGAAPTGSYDGKASFFGVQTDNHDHSCGSGYGMFNFSVK